MKKTTELTDEDWEGIFAMLGPFGIIIMAIAYNVQKNHSNK